MSQSGQMDRFRLMVLDPAHFHAALVQKEMYSGVSPKVDVYAPLGLDLADYLTRVARFNLRPDNPTYWQLEIHTGPDFLERMAAEHPGNFVVMSGRNQAKIDRILKSVSAGIHVLADKPWILSSAGLPKISQALDLADSKRLIAFDIMTERFEITSILQRALVNDPAVFGRLDPGSPSDPSIVMESIHRIMKTVAGVPNLRPPWFFDVRQQGEALSDVGAHLVDLVQWISLPDQAIDFQSDIRILAAKHWPTRISPDQWRRVTGTPDFPSFLSAIVRDGSLDYFCNNSVTYTLRGVHVHLDVLWDFEGPPPFDSHFAKFRGTTSSIEVRQTAAENFQPEVYVVPASPELRPAVLLALRNRIAALPPGIDGIGVEDRGAEFKLTIPAKHRVGHEAHFAQVTRQFFSYLDNPRSLPAWEKPNMLAKYAVTTKGVELARAGDAR
jgi:predicted dehydrogenase